MEANPQHTQSSVPYSPKAVKLGRWEETQWRLSYVKFIKSCYRNHPECFNYYEQLVDHVEQGPKISHSWLQMPKLFEVTPLQSGSTFPFCFPLQPTGWDHEQRYPRVAVLEGFPSPTYTAFLGARWDLRPEFFIGHMFPGRGQTQRDNLFEQPTLPSRRDNIIRVQLASLVKSLVEVPVVESHTARRLEVDEAFRQCEKDLLSDRRYGATRFRRINLHDGQFCSVEQTVSLTVATEKLQWTAIFLTDQGQSIMEHDGLPWSRYNPNGRPAGTLPLVPYNIPAETSQRPYEPHGSDTELPASLDQFHPLKNVLVRDATDLELMSEDPFYLLWSLLTISAMSWCQILNYLRESIMDHQKAMPGQLSSTLEQLQYHSGIINRIKESLTCNLYWIEQGGCPSWPKATNLATQERKSHLQQQSKADHQQLLAMCSSIVRDCGNATTFLVGSAQLESSKDAIRQAGEVHRITRLASFFVPVSFVATVFGMNVDVLKDTVPWWTSLLSGITLLLLTGLVLYKEWLKWLKQQVWREFLRRHSD